MTRRTKFVAAIAVGVALFGAYTAYWFYVAAQLAKGIDDWAAAQRQAGWTVTFERSAIRGFPLDFTSTFGDPHIAGMIAGQAFDWHGADTEAKVSPLDLHTMRLDGAGRHTLD